MDKALCVQVDGCDSFSDLFGYLGSYGNCVDLKDEGTLKNSRQIIVSGTVLQLNPVVWKDSPEGGLYDCLTLYMKTVLPNGNEGMRVRVIFLGDVVHRLHKSQLFEQDVICIMNPKLSKSFEYTTLCTGPKNAIVWFWKPKVDILKNIRNEQTKADMVKEKYKLDNQQQLESNTSIFSIMREIEAPGQSARSVIQARERKKLQKQLRNSESTDKCNKEKCLCMKKSNKSTGYVSGESSSLRRPNDSPRSELLAPTGCLLIDNNQTTHSQMENSHENNSEHRQQFSINSREMHVADQIRILLPTLVGKYVDQVYHNWWQNLSRRCPCANCQPVPVCCEHKNDMANCPSISSPNTTFRKPKQASSIKSVSVKSNSVRSDSGKCHNKYGCVSIKSVSVNSSVSESNVTDLPAGISTPINERTEEWVRNVIGYPPPDIDSMLNSDKEETENTEINKEVETSQQFQTSSPSCPPLETVPFISPLRKKRKLFTVPNGSDIFIPHKRRIASPTPSSMSTKLSDVKSPETALDPSASIMTDSEQENNKRSQSTIDLDKFADDIDSTANQDLNRGEDKLRSNPPDSSSENSTSYADALNIEDKSKENSFASNVNNIAEGPDFIKNLSSSALASLNELFSFLDDDYRQRTINNLKEPNKIFDIYGVLIGILPELSGENKMSIIRGICHQGCKRAVPYEKIAADDYMKVRCNNCLSFTHWICPYCIEANDVKLPLCLTFTFELHLLNGMDVLRVQVRGSEAEMFLNCTAKKYVTYEFLSEKVFKKLELISVKTLPDNWAECVLMCVTVRTMELNESVIPLLHMTRLDDCLTVQRKKFYYPSNL